MTDSNSSTAVDRPVYYSSSIGVRFLNDNPIANNEYLKDIIEDIKKFDPDSVVTMDGTTCLTIDSEKFSYFCHMIYCQIPENNTMIVVYDGIHPFSALDQDGVEQLFNGQMVTIHQQTIT